MTLEQVLNFQYRKVLTNKLRIKEYIQNSHKFKTKTVSLREIEVLSLLLTELDNLNNEEINIEESEIIKKYISCLTTDNEYENEYKTEEIYQIYEIGKNKKINDELNKLIAIKYAEYINKTKPLNPIGISILENLN